MTPEEIKKMLANRHIDSLISEFVMGIKTYPDEFDGAKVWNKPYEDKDAQIIPSYSTDIAAAWEVVEKIKSLDLLSEFIEYFHSELGDFSISEFLSDLSPLSICRAALFAKAKE